MRECCGQLYSVPRVTNEENRPLVKAIQSLFSQRFNVQFIWTFQINTRLIPSKKDRTFQEAIQR
jgi:hypothetical protein